MAKNFALEPLVDFSFPLKSNFNVQAIVAGKDWVTLGSKSPELVVINNGTRLHTIQENDDSIRENVYAIGHTPLSTREKDTLFYQNSLIHKPSTKNYTSLKALLDATKKEIVDTD